MKLNEKILYCRKKAGLSQEALADRLGVSRQAVSKWENGDAEPEIGKLRLLAAEFDVTADWLLSEEEPEDKAAYEPEQPTPAEANTPADWLDAVPGFMGKMLRRYGWLFGVYLAVGGAGFALIGGMARYITGRMTSGFMDSSYYGFSSSMPSDITLYGSLGQQLDPMSSMMANNPVTIMGTIIMILGIVMIIAGVILAVVLKKRNGEK